MGLRLSEALNLTIADIDSARHKVHVRCGKGDKDRFVILPERTLVMLRNYWASHRNPIFLFPRGKTDELRGSADGHCKMVGRGLPALQYLSRYLYRGVIAEKNILCGQNGHITFRYRDNKQQSQTRTLRANDLLKLVLQHVLPKGFRPVRDYGYLHGNAKQTLKRVQWALQVDPPKIKQRERPSWHCKHCAGAMHIVSTYRRRFYSG
ncbi:MAG: hypothetical protein ACJAYF_003119 [Arenicella sp.]|jgi:hypothetical protein